MVRQYIFMFKWPFGCINIKILFYKYRKIYFGNTIVRWSPYCHNFPIQLRLITRSGVRDTKAVFINSSLMGIWIYLIIWTTFIFDRCHHIQAASTLVKYKYDIEQGNDVLITMKTEKIVNGVNWFSNFSSPHFYQGGLGGIGIGWFQMHLYDLFSFWLEFHWGFFLRVRFDS